MNILLTPIHEGGPIYLQVKNQLEEAIRSGQIAVGESLPSPTALATKLSTDKGEIVRSYFELEQAGLIEKVNTPGFLGSTTLKYKAKRF